MKSKRLMLFVTFAALVGFQCRSLTDKEIRGRVVQLEGEKGYCTGEQVQGRSGKLYILTAGHCVGLGKLTATTEGGKKQKVRLVYEAKYSDLALYTPVKGLEPFHLRMSYPHDKVRIFGHGGGHPTYEVKGEMLEGAVTDIEDPSRILDTCTEPKYKKEKSLWDSCTLHTYNLYTTAWAIGGTSGGPAVDSSGNLIGVVSGGNDHFTLLVPSWTVANLLRHF